jgi:hypothetical protein
LFAWSASLALVSSVASAQDACGAVTGSARLERARRAMHAEQRPHDAQYEHYAARQFARNGKVVIGVLGGTRSEFMGDFIFSDFVVQRGYAYAGTLNFSPRRRHGRLPPDAADACLHRAAGYFYLAEQSTPPSLRRAARAIGPR